jgi:hypothetical protein
MTGETQPPAALIELLVIPDCPNARGARELVDRVAAELGIVLDVETSVVKGAGAAERRRFLGSPTIRVNGHDLEPGADERADFAPSCRIYRTPAGLSGLPDESWLREALASADRTSFRS